MKEVKDQFTKTMAVILNPSDYMQTSEKVFFTRTEDILQVGSLFFPQGSKVQPHIHKLRQVSRAPMEVVIVLRGVANCEIYDEEKNLIDTCQIRKGDIVIQHSGGHGFTFLEDAILLEVKNGPYYGKDSDKVMI